MLQSARLCVAELDLRVGPCGVRPRSRSAAQRTRSITHRERFGSVDGALERPFVSRADVCGPGSLCLTLAPEVVANLSPLNFQYKIVMQLL